MTEPKSLRAILIDPIARAVTEVVHTGDFRHIYTLLSDEPNGLVVDDFNIVGLNSKMPVHDTLFVDGEGLLKEPKYFILLRGFDQPLPGRGVVLGTDQAGDSAATTLSVDEVKAMVQFAVGSVVGFETFEGRTDENYIFGPGVPIIGSRAIFGPPKDDGNGEKA